MDELKACPFCGAELDKHGCLTRNGVVTDYYIHPAPDEVRDDECPLCGCVFRAATWNRRPLEDALQAEIDRLREAQRWIPVGERMPECEPGMASKYVDIAYRIPGSRSYMRETVQYWEKYGWVFKWKNGKAETFDDYYIVEFWKPLFPLPQPPQEAEG